MNTYLLSYYRESWSVFVEFSCTGTSIKYVQQISKPYISKSSAIRFAIKKGLPVLYSRSCTDKLKAKRVVHELKKKYKLKIIKLNNHKLTVLILGYAKKYIQKKERAKKINKETCANNKRAGH